MIFNNYNYNGYDDDDDENDDDDDDNYDDNDDDDNVDDYTDDDNNDDDDDNDDNNDDDNDDKIMIMMIMMVIIIMMINCIHYPFRSLFSNILFYFNLFYSTPFIPHNNTMFTYNFYRHLYANMVLLWGIKGVE